MFAEIFNARKMK